VITLQQCPPTQPTPHPNTDTTPPHPHTFIIIRPSRHPHALGLLLVPVIPQPRVALLGTRGADLVPLRLQRVHLLIVIHVLIAVIIDLVGGGVQDGGGVGV